jgi:repressor LexA
MEKQPLTSRQKEILNFLESFTQEFGYPPTVREICKATGLRSPRSVSQHLQALERKGYIQRGRDKSRAIRFLHKPTTLGSALPDTVRAIPLLGKVAAGHTTTASDHHDATFLVDRQLVDGEKSFMMKVEGHSMIDAHIVEGDYIVVNPDRSTASGDIVVAKIGSETTVKRFEHRGDRSYLVPANPTMKPMDITELEDKINFLGKVVGIIRRMD